MLVYRYSWNCISLNRPSSSESFALEKVLDDFFGEKKWSSKQSFLTLIYKIDGYTEYEITVIMKTIEMVTKGKIKYVK